MRIAVLRGPDHGPPRDGYRSWIATARHARAATARRIAVVPRNVRMAFTNPKLAFADETASHGFTGKRSVG